MTKREIYRLAKDTRKKYCIRADDYSSFCEAAESLGFTVVDFSSTYKDAAWGLVEALNIEEQALSSKGFSYADRDYRILFVSRELNQEEKILILAHELGHIVCEHFNASPVIGREIKQEHEANEFAHYLLGEKEDKGAVALLVVAAIGLIALVSTLIKKK